jgi:hypothetical protein
LKRIKVLARPERLELPTYWFEASRSIQLSYGRALPHYNRACPPGRTPAPQMVSCPSTPHIRPGDDPMKEWAFAQTHPSEELAQLSYFTIKKKQPGGDVEFLITVKEYVTPADPTMLFYATADKQTNQKTIPYTPVGWGRTLLEALADCVRAIHKFPYEGP